MHIIAKSSLEWWRASGERTADRLFGIVEHQAKHSGIHDPDLISDLYREALTGVHSWELAA